MAYIKSPKKLIEVALPLDEINEASSKEKSVRHGHPSTIHPWWASRSLAASRAILFAQLVNDPGGERGWYKGKTKEDANRERERLFNIMRELVKWENTTNQKVIDEARAEIQKSWKETCELNGLDPETPLQFWDPFNGRGFLPLEAQRLGLITNSSDLNPVAVMIGKSLIEIPKKFYCSKPIGPITIAESDVKHNWEGATGLGEDIRRFGARLNELAYGKLHSLYPDIEIPSSHGGGRATVLAWLWARTVPSPNPAANNIEIPLVSSFVISDVSGREAWVEPILNNKGYSFKVHQGKIPPGALRSTKSGKGAFNCLITGSPIALNYIKEMGMSGKMGKRLMAILVEKDNQRFFLSPDEAHEALALSFKYDWGPTEKLSTHPQYMGPPRYGLTTFADLFTERQLATLDTFCSLLEDIEKEIVLSGGSQDYAKAVCTYLGLCIGKCVDYWSTLTRWMPRGTVGNVFATHALPMIWDFPEANPFSNFHCSWLKSVEWMAKVVERSYKDIPIGTVIHSDARHVDYSNMVVSTDPPYYDNVPYSDISDYFYIWLRRGLRKFYPDLFASIQTPKLDEIVADVQRWGGRANEYFMSGMSEVMQKISSQGSPYFPVTIYYAFKQSESNEISAVSRGWQAFLEAVISSGFQITGTWPVRTERKARNRARDSNALASSIVLVCRRRSEDAGIISYREFIRELKEELPEAINLMIGSNNDLKPIDPVDLDQAAIGPGIAVYSKYNAVLEADGSKLSVGKALSLVNKVIDESFSEVSSDYDANSRFCIRWFEEYGWNAGIFGEADVIARAKGTTVGGLSQSGIIRAGHGKVQLLKWGEYDQDWVPELNNETPVWEALHHMVHSIQKNGEQATGILLAGMPERSELIRQLAYRLYRLCERKGWADDARHYNELIASWDAIHAAADEFGQHGSQLELF